LEYDDFTALSHAWSWSVAECLWNAAGKTEAIQTEEAWRHLARTGEL